jgi:hypothetical protein
MHGLTGGSWKRSKCLVRATGVGHPRGKPQVFEGSGAYSQITPPRQFPTLQITAVPGPPEHGASALCGLPTVPVS